MMKQDQRIIPQDLLSRTLLTSIIAAILFFFLGSGIARFLGNQIQMDVLFIGMGGVIFTVASGFFLRSYFDFVDPEIRKNTNSEGLNLEKQKNVYLLFGLATLTGASILAYLIALGRSIPNSAFIFMAILFGYVFIFAIPPFRLGSRGYGEFILCVLLVDIIPAFAFLLQTDVLHQLIPLITFPLTGFYFAMLISTSLHGYFSDMISGRKAMIIVIGWKLGMDIHNWLIIGAFVLVAVNSILGLPWSLTWPMLLPAPIFFFTFYEITRIKSGAKPRWNLLSLSSYSGIGILVYLLIFTLWFR